MSKERKIERETRILTYLGLFREKKEKRRRGKGGG